MSDTSSVPTFVALDQFNVEGRGTVYTGKCPADLSDRSRAIGFEVLFNGRIRKIKALESFARLTGPGLGEPVGLMFDEEPA